MPTLHKGESESRTTSKVGEKRNCEIPTIGMDYTYMKSKADRGGEQEQEEEGPERERRNRDLDP